MREATVETTEKRTPLWLYGVLDIPYGVVTTGLFTTSMAFLLARSGMKTGEIASTLALMNLPITFYFLYAPVVDFLMRRKVWAALMGSGAGVLGGAGLWELGRSVQWAVVLLFFASALATLVSAASGGMMASLLNREEKARVGGWIQGGNLGAGSLVGGLLLWLAAKHGNGLLGAIVVGTCVLPALCALAVREPHREKRVERLSETFRGLGQEMKGMFFNWKNVPGMLVLASPVGTGAMQSLMGGLTKQYGATETQLAFASGWGGGLLTAVGSLCAILWPARLNRMVPYIGSSVLYMAIMAAVSMGPMRASTLVLGVLASNFATGLCYGCYTGLVLQTLGEGGRRQSSRYTLLNAVGNLPIVYMLWLCGRVAERFGPRSIAGFDALMNAVTILLFFVWWWTWGSREGRVGV